MVRSRRRPRRSRSRSSRRTCRSSPSTSASRPRPRSARASATTSACAATTSSSKSAGGARRAALAAALAPNPRATGPEGDRDRRHRRARHPGRERSHLARGLVVERDAHRRGRAPTSTPASSPEMKRDLEEARLLVVNHALFFADLAVKMAASGRGFAAAGALPPYDAVIFDEAHELEAAATDFFGVRISGARVEALARDADRAFVAAVGLSRRAGRQGRGDPRSPGWCRRRRPTRSSRAPRAARPGRRRARGGPGQRGPRPPPSRRLDGRDRVRLSPARRGARGARRLRRDARAATSPCASSPAGRRSCAPLPRASSTRRRTRSPGSRCAPAPSRA